MGTFSKIYGNVAVAIQTSNFRTGFKRIRLPTITCGIVGFSEVEILVRFNTLWPSKGYMKNWWLFSSLDIHRGNDRLLGQDMGVFDELCEIS